LQPFTIQHEAMRHQPANSAATRQHNQSRAEPANSKHKQYKNAVQTISK
jgi:hypothetical protein